MPATSVGRMVQVRSLAKACHTACCSACKAWRAVQPGKGGAWAGMARSWKGQCAAGSSMVSRAADLQGTSSRKNSRSSCVQSLISSSASACGRCGGWGGVGKPMGRCLWRIANRATVKQQKTPGGISPPASSACTLVQQRRCPQQYHTHPPQPPALPVPTCACASYSRPTQRAGRPQMRRQGPPSAPRISRKRLSRTCAGQGEGGAPGREFCWLRLQRGEKRQESAVKLWPEPKHC